MAWQFDVNISALIAADATGIAWMAFKDLAVLNNAYSVVGSGDGLAAFENDGETGGPFDVLTSGASTWNSGSANEYSNPRAWVRIRESGSTREWIIQRSSSAASGGEDDLAIGFDPAGFTGGGAAADTPPAGSGAAVFMLGTAFNTTGAQWANGPSVNVRIHVGVQDAAQAGDVYPWYIVMRDDATNAHNAFAIYEAVEEGISGDTQPWVARFLQSAPIFTSTENNWGSYRDFGGGSELFLDPVALLGASPGGLLDGANNRMMPGFFPPQEDGSARDFPMFFGRESLANYRGKAINIRWKDTDSRDYPDTIDLALATARIYFDDLILPWEQGTTPL